MTLEEFSAIFDYGITLFIKDEEACQQNEPDVEAQRICETKKGLERSESSGFWLLQALPVSPARNI